MNLFAKIFLGFWLSTAAIVSSWLLASQYFETSLDELSAATTLSTGTRQSAGTRQPPPPPPAGRPSRGTQSPDARPERDSPEPPREIYRIYYGLQNVAAAELLAWIKAQEQRASIDIRLVTLDGKEIFGRELLPGSARILRRLSGFRRRVSLREGELMLFGQELYRPEWGQLHLVIAKHPAKSTLLQLLLEHLWLRLLLALTISGAISYAVSHYLTRSLKDLQRASRDLAKGRLDTRIAVSARGGDEVTELARDFNSMAAQLQDTIGAQKRLLNDVSHELRSPLARLRVALALLEKDPARTPEQLLRMERETERLDELIGQLLAVPDAQVELEDSLDLVSLLQQLCADASFENQGEGKAAQFNCSLSEAVVATHADLLKKAFENVIRNAIHFTAAGTSVQVDLARSGEAFVIRCTDSGPGVPTEDLLRIFEPFYRVDEARQRETGGFGLGLSISRRAIAQHGGSIQAENTGSGLRTTISLPA